MGGDFVPRRGGFARLYLQRRERLEEHHGDVLCRGQLHLHGDDQRRRRIDRHEQRRGHGRADDDEHRHRALSTNLSANGIEPFAATALDQFGNALATQPAFTWSLVGDGTIDNNGNFAPPYTAGSATVVAAAGTVTGTYDVRFPGSAEWTSNTGGSWDSGTDWTAASNASVADPGLREVAGDTVVFDTSSPVTVSLDSASPSVAGVSFTGSGGDEIAQGSGGTLQLDNGGSPATVSVIAGTTDTISAPVALQSDAVLTPGTGSQLNVSGNISGTGQSLSVNGAGTVVLGGAEQLQRRHDGLGRHARRDQSGIDPGQHQPDDWGGRGVHLRSDDQCGPRGVGKRGDGFARCRGVALHSPTSAAPSASPAAAAAVGTATGAQAIAATSGVSGDTPMPPCRQLFSGALPRRCHG